ncbi:hypothetical protein EPB68_06360 [Enterococcus faecalis]|nr:hypothetical protein EPB68_06360 [Enterococcus faecalis]
MKKWTGKELAEHIISYHKTNNPLLLAKIYGFEINHIVPLGTPAMYIIHDDGKKEILVDLSMSPNLSMFHIGKQLALYLLEHPEEIMGVD